MRFLTSTAAVLALTTTGAMAEQHMSEPRSQMHQSTAMDAMTTDEMAQAEGNLIRTRDITGGRVYTSNEANDEGWDPNVMYDQIGADWNEIGEIEDIVLTPEGKITGIVAEVGGFLDLGDKHVMLSVADLNLVAVDDRTYAYVTRFNEEDLEEMPDVDEAFWN